MNEYLPLKQQIQMLAHGAGQGVFHWDDRSRGTAQLKGIKDLNRSCAGHDLRARRHFQRCLVAERSTFALDRYFLHSCSSAPGSGSLGDLTPFAFDSMSSNRERQLEEISRPYPRNSNGIKNRHSAVSNQQSAPAAL